MRKDRAVRPLTPQQYKTFSTLFQLFGLALIVIALLAGRPDIALALFVGFWIGAACASYGAQSRTVAAVQTQAQARSTDIVQELLNKIRERQQDRTDK